ncbi:glycosyltransferase family [Trichomonas vaginalis G3]|uniref:glycosyltransferase family n=1 Tax=Trichomonas vaginalis (strain ATCC PRA-98 / G3) TaxID=412133 RepID=UPI0021E61043|nr:glycosyltransferase family [Trichomonas vaginalis G3]KAI5487155.1 glycosyltransferase family [Trichomonas vaginalis G3]
MSLNQMVRYPYLNEIKNTKLIRYIPSQFIISESIIIHKNDYGGAQLTKNGAWESKEENYPNQPLILPHYFDIFNCTMALLRNVYINHASAIVTNDYFIIPDENDWFVATKKPGEGKVIASYDKAIAVGRDSDRYGHWILDYMGPLLLLPIDVILTHKILNIPNIPIAHEMLDFLGVPKENRIFRMKKYELIHCNSVYFPYRPLVNADYIGYPIQLIRDFVHKHLNLSQINQTKYAFYQRQATRKIINFDQMVSTAKSSFPEYNWECLQDRQSLIECGKIWAAIKLMISGNGSHLFRCVCLKKGCVVVEILGAYNDLSCMGALYSCGVHVISIKNPSISYSMWWGGSSYNAEIDKIMKSIRYLKPYLDGKEFPKDSLRF